MERNLKLLVAYDGTDFHGWQRQPALRTVQEQLEQVGRHVLRHPVAVLGASRTDAGVHARGQVACLRSACALPEEGVRRALDQRLPADVAVLAVRAVPPEFHPSRSARSKLYRYRILHGPGRSMDPLAARYAWHVWHPLDVERMRAAARFLVGAHDFSAFASRGSPRVTMVRTVLRIGIRRRYEQIEIDVEGDGFLYHQVRNMVGTLVEVGRGHWKPERAAEILASRDRRQAGPTAPPEGLCLQWVRYDRVGQVTDGS